MKVFISWSGNRSKAVAELLKGWIKCVLQASRPWISTRIDRGALWYNEIIEQLKDTTVGIVCLTHDNKEKPWILFESGAIAKGLASSRVCTLLIDLATKDVGPPLAQFNHTTPDKEGIWTLVETLNKGLESHSLGEGTLQNVFETYWPKFESEFARILKEVPAEQQVAPRPPGDMLSEILENTRSTNTRIGRLEARVRETERSVGRHYHHDDHTENWLRIIDGGREGGLDSAIQANWNNLCEREKEQLKIKLPQYIRDAIHTTSEKPDTK